MFKKFWFFPEFNVTRGESWKTTVQRGGGNVLEIYLQTIYKNIQAGKILQLLMFCFDDTKKLDFFSIFSWL